MDNDKEVELETTMKQMKLIEVIITDIEDNSKKFTICGKDNCVVTVNAEENTLDIQNFVSIQY